jgi:probable rRNA maturation factor
LIPYVDSLVETSCRNAIHASGIADKANTIEVSVLLTGDAFIQQLNKEYRGQDKPTNVLSFQSEELKAGQYDDVEEFVMLGDIAIALETIVAEANEQQKDLKHHLCHMTVHGALHLLGYDHIDDNEAEVMEGLEAKILADMGIDNPYEDSIKL